MKILAIGDPHGKLPKNLNKIIKKNKIEIIVCVGDIPPVPKNFKGIAFPIEFRKKSDKLFKTIVKKLCSYKLPFLTLRGNMYLRKDTSRLTIKIFREYKNLFYKRMGKLRIKDKNFVFFDMFWEPHNIRHKATLIFTKLNKIIEKKLNNLLRELEAPIVISHIPPYGYLDKTKSEKHMGSKVFLNAIKKYQPQLVLCGHIHEAKGEARIGKTKVINLGCCGSYKIIKI